MKKTGKNKSHNDNPAPPDTRTVWQKLRGSWEYRSVRFILRMLVVFIFLSYVFFNIRSVVEWPKTVWIRSQPLQQLETVAKKYLAQQKPEKVFYWVMARPSAEREEIMKILKPYTGELDSSTFIAYSDWMYQQGRKDEAVFWYQFARYRLRFDALRCGSPEAVNSMKGLLIAFSRPEVLEEVAAHKDIKSVIGDVMKLDGEYPAHNNPAHICTFLNKLDEGSFTPVKESDWHNIRFTLRYVTQKHLGEIPEDEYYQGDDENADEATQAP